MKETDIQNEESIYKVQHRFVCEKRRHEPGDKRVGDWHSDYNDALRDSNKHSDKYPDHNVYIETRQERRAYRKVGSD